MYLTQPTLTKMIQRLEENLEQQLLIRNNQKVELTQAGIVFKHRAQQIVGQWHRLQEDMSNLNGLKTGTLRLGVCPMMSSLIIDLLTEFIRTYPGIELQMHEYGGFGCEQALLNDTLDIAFTALPLTHSDQLAALPLLRYPLMVCLPNDHPLSSQHSLRWSDLAPYPYINYNEDFSLAKLIRNVSTKSGVSLNIAFRSGQWDFLAAMVEAHMGIAILPEPICNKIGSNKLVYIPMTPEITWDLAMIWRKNLPLTPAAQALLSLAKVK